MAQEGLALVMASPNRRIGAGLAALYGEISARDTASRSRAGPW
jgi:hypothetical protein